MSLTSSFWLSRIVFLRGLAFLYFVAFLISFDQNSALIGINGLTPAINYLDSLRLRHQHSSSFSIFFEIPTIFWYLPPTDILINVISMLGMIMSFVIFLKGASNSILLFLLWILYMSIVNIGQTWYSFGWESLLLEIGFLAIFIVPVWKISSLPFLFHFPLVPLIGYRWLIFRVMLGAGLIKIRGDPCWVSPQYSCMFYHYETQPVPNPLSPYLHILPESFHRFETLFNHFIELVCPFLVLIPNSRSCRLIGALLQIFFQTLIIISGNLSFLNWLTILPCLTLLDDSFLSSFIPFSSDTLSLVTYLNTLSPSPYSSFMNFQKIQSQTSSISSSILPTLSHIMRYITHFFLLCLLSYYSIPVVTNLISSQQIMNTSYDPFRILNTYGAFGSITKVRHEVVLQGTYLDPYSNSSSLPPIWIDYEFLCKPGQIDRRPCLITPYHYRLDWLMWFAGHYQSYQSVPWLIHLSVKLLQKDPKILRIMDYSLNNDMETRLEKKYRERWTKMSGCHENENAGVCLSNVVDFQQNITHIRAQLYQYQYATNRLTKKDLENYWEEGTWWRRNEIRSFMPVISLDDPSVAKYLEHYGWSIKEQGNGDERS